MGRATTVVDSLSGHTHLGRNGQVDAFGRHDGQMFLRGEVDPRRLGKEVKIGEVTPKDTRLLRKHVGDFCAYFGVDPDEIFKKPFAKIYPYSHRPYGTIYAY